MLQSIIALSHIIVFCGYSYWIAQKYGVLTSVSASTYALEGNSRYIFWAVLTYLAFSNLAMGMAGWGFLASAGIGFAGVTVNHRGGTVGSIPHTVGTLASIIGTYIGFIILKGVIFPTGLAIALVAYIWFSDIKNKIWWIEITLMILAGFTYLYIYLPPVL